MSFFGIGKADKSEQEKVIAQREAELGVLETEYAEQNAIYSTLEAEIAAFRNRYYLRVGSLYSRLDRLIADIAALKAKAKPDDQAAAAEAEKADAQANETEEEVSGAEEEDPIEFKPSADLKTLFRRATKLIHPDRAKNEVDRKFRDNLMAEVNLAYRMQDANKIEELIQTYKDKLDLPEWDEHEMRLAHLNTLIDKTRAQIQSLKDNMEALQKSRWYTLKSEVDAGEKAGLDPLGDLAESLHKQILENQEVLNALLQEESTVEEVEVPIKPVEPAKPSDSTTKRKKKPESPKYEFRPGGTIHRTARGEMVRSKSEVIVANTLHALGIDYRYEYPVEGRFFSGIRRPDFAFFTKSGNLILWEHLGMLNNRAYAEGWNKKLEWYRSNGFELEIDLFTTQDEEDGSLDSQVVFATAKKIEGLLKR